MQIIVNSEDATDMVIYVYINDYKYLHDVTFVLFRKQMKMLTENTGWESWMNEFFFNFFFYFEKP